VEDETLIESILFLIGTFTIFIGFLIMIIGIALDVVRESESRQDYSKRKEPFGKETTFGNTPDSEEPPHQQPPSSKIESKIKGGGVIMLGPIPIIFGSDKESAKTVTILAIILMLLSLLVLRGSFF
jgi:uncharacterized protein (TIGR00304 family)